MPTCVLTKPILFFLRVPRAFKKWQQVFDGPLILRESVPNPKGSFYKLIGPILHRALSKTCPSTCNAGTVTKNWKKKIQAVVVVKARKKIV